MSAWNIGGGQGITEWKWKVRREEGFEARRVEENK